MLLSEQRLHAFDAALGYEKVVFGKSSAEGESVFVVCRFAIGTTYEVELANEALMVRIATVGAQIYEYYADF